MQPEQPINKPKPKFAPKIPAVKKESTESAREATDAKPVSTETDNKHKNQKSNKYNNNNSGRGGRGGGHGGRGPHGGGRGGQWTMPLGPLFFSAGATQNIAVNAPTTSNAISTSGRQLGSSKLSGRPNEIIADDANSNRIQAPVAKVKTEAADATSISSGGRGPSPFNLTTARSESSDDSDASEPETSLLTKKANMKKLKQAADESDDEKQFLEGNHNRIKREDNDEEDDNAAVLSEQWPPLSSHSQQRNISPITLPLGPKTGAVRRLLQQQPILAHPADEQGVRHEQENALFLVQLPSDLNLRHLLDGPNNNNNNNNNNNTNDSSAAATPSHHAMDVDHDTTKTHSVSSAGKRPVFRLGDKGYLGKVQLLKSGRVRFLIPTAPTDDNNNNNNINNNNINNNNNMQVMEFEVGAGLMTSFYQDILAVQSPGSSAAETSEGGAASTSASTSVENKVELGSVCMLGNVTRKLVVTPPFDVLGEKKDKLHATACFADAVLAVQTDAQEAQFLQEGAQTLGFSQYLERLNGGAGDITADQLQQQQQKQQQQQQHAQNNARKR